MFSDVVAEDERGVTEVNHEKDRRQENWGKKEDGTGKLEIFIAASFPFYAESRDRGRFHSTRFNTIRYRDVITSRYFKRHRTMESNNRKSSGYVLTKAIIERKI